MSLTGISLTEPSFFDTVKKQFLYKLKGRLGLFLAMIGVQIMALLFSLSGASSHGMGDNLLYFSFNEFSSDQVIWFTFLWIFVVAVLITTKDYQNIDFTFVANRLSSHLSNVGFLITAAVIGGVTAMLSGILLRIVIYFTRGRYLLSENFIAAPEVVLTGIAVTILYLLLVSALGYFCGVLVQLSKVFIVILPALYIGTVDFLARELPVIVKVYNFIIGENSLALLAVKVLITTALIYACSCVLANRLEVR